jgi:hypothetical protein
MREEALIWTWQIPHPALTDILLNTSSDSRAVVSTLLRRALSSLRGEGPHQLPQKRSLALGSILQSLAALKSPMRYDARISAQ